MRSEVSNIETNLTNKVKLGKSKWRLTAKAETAMQTSYRMELYVSPELEHIEAEYYQSLIGTLRCMLELGRVDI